MNDEFPRLSVEPTEPPAPLKFPGDNARRASNPTTSTEALSMAEDALAKVQSALNTLEELSDQSVLPFPGRDAGSDDDDDGPRAA